MNWLAGDNFQFDKILKIENFYQCVFKLKQTDNINISSTDLPQSVDNVSNVSAYIAVKNVDNFLIPDKFVLQQLNFPGTKSTTSTNEVTVSWSRMCIKWSLFFILFWKCKKCWNRKYYCIFTICLADTNDL